MTLASQIKPDDVFSMTTPVDCIRLYARFCSRRYVTTVLSFKRFHLERHQGLYVSYKGVARKDVIPILRGYLPFHNCIACILICQRVRSRVRKYQLESENLLNL